MSSDSAKMVVNIDISELQKRQYEDVLAFREGFGDAGATLRMTNKSHGAIMDYMLQRGPAEMVLPEVRRNPYVFIGRVLDYAERREGVYAQRSQLFSVFDSIGEHVGIPRNDPRRVSYLLNKAVDDMSNQTSPKTWLKTSSGWKMGRKMNVAVGGTFVNLKDKTQMETLAGLLSDASGGLGDSRRLHPDEAVAFIKAVANGHISEEMGKQLALSCFFVQDGRLGMSYRSVFFGEIETAGVLGSMTGPSALNLDGVRINELIAKYERIRTAHGEKFKLEPEQRDAVIKSLSNQVSVITGGPGRGKTTVTDCLCFCYQQVTGKAPVLTAHPGKATSRLVEVIEKSGMVTDLDTGYSGTMLSFVYRYAGDDYLNTETGKPLFDGRLVVIDEASMIGQDVIRSFLPLLRGAQVVFVGDVDQLPSVSAGQVFADIINSGVVPGTRLERNMRVRAGRRSVLVDAADSILDDSIDTVLNDMRNKDAETFCWKDGTDTGIDSMVAEYVRRVTAYSDQKKGLESTVMLSAMKVHVSELNAKASAELNPGATPCPLRGCEFSWGDRVILTKNMTVATGTGGKDRVLNGDVGMVHGPVLGDRGEIKGVVFARDRGVTVELDTTEARSLLRGYAMTVHRSQGSEYESVLLYTPEWLPPGLGQQNLIYTAVTRASSHVLLYGSKQRYRICSQTPQPIRQTLLQYVLAGGGVMRVEDHEWTNPLW